MKPQHIHIIGIGGSGASGVARYLRSLGFTVSGSDHDHRRIADLNSLGINVFAQHRAENIMQPDLVLFSPGVYAAEEELNAARQTGIPVLSWQQFLGAYLDRRPGQGYMVAGTYGKGSTAAILSHILDAAYLDPLVILGVEDRRWASNFRLGLGDAWVLEADEFNRNFLHFHPAYAILTSLEHEHISTYPTMAEYQNAFGDFFRQMHPPHMVVVKAVGSIISALPVILPEGALTYGFSDHADVQGSIKEQSLDGTIFTITAKRYDVDRQELRLNVPGRMHVDNALGAVALALASGLSLAAVNAGLERFQGLRRRFEIVRHDAMVTIFDYAHTPDRIAAVLEQTQELFPERTVSILFEPHLYSRTVQLLNDFRKILGLADRAFVTDIFPSREANSPLKNSVNSQMFEDRSAPSVRYVGTLEQGISSMTKTRSERDVVLVLGAGPIQTEAERLIK